MGVESKERYQMSIFVAIRIIQRSLTEPETHCFSSGGWPTSSQDLHNTLLACLLSQVPAMCLTFMWVFRSWTRQTFPSPVCLVFMTFIFW